MVSVKQHIRQPYHGFFGDWAMTISALLIMSFVGGTILLGASTQPEPRQIYLQKAEPQVLSEQVYIYDAPTTPVQ